ncbi:hypothetical protein C8F01DRAFT_1161525, partial [Mycena amicta]
GPQDLIAKGFEFNGVFAFSKQYPIHQAPNPCLSVDSIGIIGLPLNQREARVIIQAQLRLTAEWNAWLHRTPGIAICDALILAGVRFVLRKLVVPRTDKLCEPTRSTIAIKAAVGELVVVLPTKSSSLPPDSGISTFVIGAYSGVEHRISQVSSGYCLSLVYEIVQSRDGAGPRPGLDSGPVQRLRNILSSWQADRAEWPEYLVCVLRDKYERTTKFSAASLIGADATLFRYLAPVAAELGFSLHFAHIDAERSIPTAVREERRHRDFYGSDDECYGDDDFTDDEDAAEESVEVKQVVDLEGMPLRVTGFRSSWPGPYDEDWEARQICEPVMDSEPDEDYLSRGDGHSGSRRQTWRCTSLLIWPTDSTVHRGVGVGEVYDYAFDRLSQSISETPTAHETLIVEHLLARCTATKQHLEANLQRGFMYRKAQIEDEEAANIRKAMGVLRGCATRWNAVDIFLRALDACEVDKNIDILGMEGLVSAYQAFGWKSLVYFCDKAMANDASSARKSVLVANLTRLAANEHDTELAAWTQRGDDQLLQVLGEVDVERIPWLVSVIASRGSITFDEILLPQLVAKKLTTDFWISFITQAHQTALATSPSTALQSCVSQCAHHLVDELAAFPTKVVTASYTWRQGQAQNASETLRVIQMCLDVGVPDLCSKIFAKMRDAARTGGYAGDFPPWQYYTELARPLMSILSTHDSGRLAEIFRPFFEDVVFALLIGEINAADGSLTPCPLNNVHKTLVLDAAKNAGGLQFLQRLTPESFKGRDSETIQDLIRLVSVSLITIAVDVPSMNATTMMKAILLCFDMGMRSQCALVLSRPGLSLTGTLGEFLSLLAQFLPTVQDSVKAEPYRTFSVAVVTGCAEHFVGEKPVNGAPTNSQMMVLGCPQARVRVRARVSKCQDCSELLSFFRDDSREILNLERKWGGLQLEATRSWGVVWEITNQGRVIKVTKPASMVALSRWKSRTEATKTILNSLGSSAEQSEILGSDYNWVYSRIHSMPMPENAPLGHGQTRTQNPLKRGALADLPAEARVKKAKSS